MKTISNADDFIDSRDIDERIEELEDLKEEFILNESKTPDDSPSWGEIADANGEAESRWGETDDGEELNALKSLKDELEGYAPDWRHGATLIRRSYFVEYCKELVKDIGDFPRDLPGYIENNINWEGVADDLEADYTTGDFDGVEYLVRS